jgi:hypothetical protein
MLAGPAASSPAVHARWRRIAPTLLLALGGTATAWLLSRVDPNAPGNLLPPCPLHALTGLYCPGCGSTRALHALLQGDVPGALAMNPLLVVALPVLAAMALNAAGWQPAGAQRLWRALGRPLPWLVVLLGYAVLRNLPWAPFGWLAPG